MKALILCFAIFGILRGEAFAQREKIGVGLPFAAPTRIGRQAEAPEPYSNLIAELYVFGGQQ